MLTVETIRRRRKIALVSVVLVLAGLLLYGVLRPDVEEAQYAALKDAIMSHEPGQQPSPEKRREFREAFERLSPETRDRLMTEIMRDRLYDAREKLKSLSVEDKAQHVEKMISDMRANFQKLSIEQRSEIKERLNSGEGRKRMKKSIDFYYTEFTPEERDLLDPLVNEIIMNIGNL